MYIKHILTVSKLVVKPIQPARKEPDFLPQTKHKNKAK